MKNDKQFVDSILQEARKIGWGVVNENINNIPGCFYGDGVTVVARNLGFLKDSDFMSSFTSAVESFERPAMKDILKSIVWRKHITCSLMKQCISVEGDFVECGVEWGFGVDVARRYLDFQKINKKWFLYDTFEGVPEEQSDDGFVVDKDITTLDIYDRVKQKFSDCSNINVIKGFLPNILNTVSPEKISFLHIDLNNAVAEMQTFIELYNRVSIGGVIVFDDFGSLLFSKQHFSEKCLFNIMGLCPTELPTGQAFIVKTSHYDFNNVHLDSILSSYSFSEFKNELLNLSEDIKVQEIPSSSLENSYGYFHDQMNYLEKMGMSGLVPKDCYDLKLNKRDDGYYDYTIPFSGKSKHLREFALILQEKIDHLQSIIDNGVRS